jgi:hypothetical protein
MLLPLILFSGGLLDGEAAQGGMRELVQVFLGLPMDLKSMLSSFGFIRKACRALKLSTAD